MLHSNSCLDYGGTWHLELVRACIRVTEPEATGSSVAISVPLWCLCHSFWCPTSHRRFRLTSFPLHVTYLFSLCTLLFLPSSHMFLPSRRLPSSDPSSPPPPPVCPFVPSSPPLLAVCYSCWSNLENVPNPLSVLLPQRNTKWIRWDYCLPLPPPSRPPLPLHPRHHSRSSSLCPSFCGHFSFHRRD